MNGRKAVMSSENPVTIALDTMSNTDGSERAVRAAATLSLRSDAPEIFLLGNEKSISTLLDNIRHDAENLALLHTGSGEALEKGCELLKEGRADALVSAATLSDLRTTCTKHFTSLPKVNKHALGAVFPTEERRGAKEDPFSLILDIGFESSAQTQDLINYALMGAAYARVISQNNQPRVALLANNPDIAQAPEHLQEAFAALEQHPLFKFIGVIEPVDIPLGKADVIVNDGFVGNMALKLLENSGSILKQLVTYAHRQKVLAQIGLMMLKPALRNLKTYVDWQEYGGAPLLGYEELCIKLAFNAPEQAYLNALRVAQKAAKNRFIDACKEVL